MRNMIKNSFKGFYGLPKRLGSAGYLFLKLTASILKIPLGCLKFQPSQLAMSDIPRHVQNYMRLNRLVAYSSISTECENAHSILVQTPSLIRSYTFTQSLFESAFRHALSTILER